MDSQQRGRQFEQLACQFLESQGLTLITRHYLRRVGEIDLVMQDHANTMWVFVEVRYRLHTRFGGPVASVTRTKQQKIIRTARAYLQEFADHQQLARIDVVGITPESVAHAEKSGFSYQGYNISWVINAIESSY